MGSNQTDVTGSPAAGRRPQVLALFDQIDTLLDANADAALFGLSPSELVEAVEAREAAARRLDALDLRLIRELDLRGVARDRGAPSTALLLGGRLLTRPADAATRTRLATALDYPLYAGTRQALSDATVSFEHAVVIERTIRAIHRSVPFDVRERAHTILLETALTLDPADLAKVARSLLIAVNPGADGDDDHDKHRRQTLALTGRHDGLTDLRAVLDPESAVIITAAIDGLAAPRPGPNGQRDPRSPGRRRAEALVEACQHALDTSTLPTTGRTRPHVSVLIPWATLTEHADDRASHLTQTGMPLPRAVIERICCDAAIRRIVLDPAGQPLDAGRAIRTPSAALRAAVIARDLCCTAPGCDRPASWSDIHHLTHWTKDGSTSLKNLALACRFHHRLAHHEGWQVRLGPYGRIQWLAPVWIDPTRTWQSNSVREARDPDSNLHPPHNPRKKPVARGPDLPHRAGRAVEDGCRLSVARDRTLVRDWTCSRRALVRGRALLRRVPARRPGQAKVFPQRAALVLLAEQTPAAQLRDHQVRKVVQRPRQVREDHIKPSPAPASNHSWM